METFKKGLKPPSLIRVLKNVLQQNPDNGQILKELLQNAEDAGATEVKFLLDWTTHPADEEKLFHSDLAQFQGPALFVFNNTEFTDDDWEGICKVNHSIKENDPTKIGRFGVGFKSVFHMTDLPQLITGHGIGFIEPHEQYFKDKDGRYTSCQAWHLKADREDIRSHVDQFQALLQCDIFGTSLQTLENGRYDGRTLFRFPLRSKPTKLSDTIYTPEKVKRLFEDLVNDAHIMLLFARNLEKFEIYERTVDKCVRPILEVKISDAVNSSVLENRRRFSEIVSTDSSEDSVTYPIGIDVTKYNGEGVGDTARTHWVVSLFNGKEILRRDQTMSDIGSKLSVLPLVGAAFKAEPTSDIESSENLKSRNDGRIFCFLPLPPLEDEFPTGLPCHVNGTFALDHTRQHVKFPNADQDPTGVTDPWISWNRFLLDRLLPSAVAKLALRLAADNPSKPGAVYSLMPDLEKVKPSWKPVTESFYKQIYCNKLDLFYAENRNSYISITKDSVVDRDITPSHIRQFLKICGIYPIVLPQYVLNGLKDCTGEFQRVAPEFVSRQYRQILYQRELDDSVKLGLLEYLINDLDVKTIAGLQLVPLADGSWMSFANSARQQEIKLYRLPNESDRLRQVCLLPGPSKHFIRNDLPPSVVEGLNKKRREGVLLVEDLGPQGFLQLLNEIEGVSGSAGFCAINRLSEDCLNAIWTRLGKCTTSLQLAESMRLHLIPFNEYKHLATLTRSISYVQTSSLTEKELVELLRHVGIITLENVPEFVTRCPLVSAEYIFPLTVPGLLNAFRRVHVNQKPVHASIHTAPSHCKEALRQFFIKILAQRNVLTPNDKHFLKSLPIFLTYERSGFADCFYTCAMNSQGVRPFLKNISVPQVLIDLNDQYTCRLAEFLDVSLVAERDVILTYVFRGINAGIYPRKALEDTMRAILSSPYVSDGNSQQFLGALWNVKFIPTKTNELAAACELYDDEDPAIKELFERKNRFPVGELANQLYRPLLRRIGLKVKETLEIRDLVELANEIQDTMNVEKARRLMEIVELKICSSNILVHNSIKTGLQNLRWIVPMSCESQKYPELLKFPDALVAPSRVSSDQFFKLIGSVVATISTNGNWSKLAALFHWNAVPKPEDVVQHFSNVIDWFQAQAHLMSSDSKLYRLAHEMFGYIYEYLEETLQRNDTQLAGLLTKKMSSKPCLLEAAHLMLPSRCTMDSDFNHTCLPIVLAVPSMTKTRIGKLLKALNVKEKFQMIDYVEMLKDLYGQTEGRPLDRDQLKLTLFIINDCLADTKIQVDVNRYPLAGKIVYVPDNRNILRPSSEVWQGPLTEETGSSVVTVIHSDIKEEAVARLGIQTKIRSLLAPHLESFGRKEKFTERIKNFLEKNLFDVETLKELVLNADNAGATKLHFVIDSRHLPDKAVFNDGWKCLQGPALTMFTDSHFADTYLQEISQDPSRGTTDVSKLDTQILTFSCTFHLTDAPTILTRTGSEKKLYVIDPTHQYITFASPMAAGCSIKNIETISSQFPDVFSGYSEEIFEVGNKSTILRLCLRQRASSLSQQVFKINDLERMLLSFFKEDICEHLLFLNNVNEIALKRISHSTNKIEDVYVVTKEMNAVESQRLQKFRNGVREFSDKFQKEKIEMLPNSHQICYDLRIKDNFGNDQLWVITLMLGFQKISRLPESIRKSYDSRKLSQLPLVGIAYRLKPVAESKPLRGRICSFLPLSLLTNLPVIVNGHFALDRENRKKLLNEDTAREKIGWNMYLFKHLVAQAYVDLILAVKEKIRSKAENISLEQFKVLFPSADLNGERTDTDVAYEQALALSVYERIGSKNEEVLPVIVPPKTNAPLSISWFRPRDDEQCKAGYFDVFSDAQSGERTLNDDRKKQELRSLLSRCGLNLYNLPIEVYKCFVRAKVTVNSINPETVLRFFRGQTEAIFASIDDSERLKGICTILEYCSQWPGFKENLFGTPLQVTQDNSVTIFDVNNQKFVGDYSGVVPHAVNQFIHPEIVRVARLNPSVADASKRTEVKQLCRYFGIQEFANLLPLLLPEEQFRGPDKRVEIRSLERHLAAFKAQSSWIGTVWNFIGTEIKSNMACKKHELTEKEFAKDVLSPLNQWCLFPVESKTGCHFLVPVRECHTRVIMTNSARRQLDEQVFNVLEKLGYSVLILDREVDRYSTDAIWLFELFLERRSRNATAFVLKVLQQLLNSPLPELDPDKQNLLLRFLSNNIKEFEGDRDAIQTIKKLPYFKLFDGTQTSLETSRGVQNVIVPAETLNKGYKVWMSASNNRRFLRPDPTIQDLLHVLDCKDIDIADLYCEYIFKIFPKLYWHLRFIHLRFLKDKVMSKISPEKSAKLAKRLKSLEFIYKRGSSAPQKASSFVDPRVELFEKMEESGSFPPKPFTQDVYRDRNGWLDFLVEHCGLVDQATESKLFAYVQKLATDLKNANAKELKKIDEKSACLIKAITATTRSRDFAEKIGNPKYSSIIGHHLKRVKLNDILPPMRSERQLNADSDDYDDDDRPTYDSSYCYDDTDGQNRMYPQRTCKKWLGQSEYDQESAKYDMMTGSYEWACYKFHQTAEKAIKAVLIRNRKMVPLSHNLVEVSSQLSEKDIRDTAIKLNRLLRNTSAMRYPTEDGQIPHELFGYDCAREAGRLAEKIFDWARLGN